MNDRDNLFRVFLTKMQTELNSKSDLAISQTILENINRIRSLDIREVARLSNVSTATVSRFVDQFDVKSYREFIHYLALSHTRMNFTIYDNHQRVVNETIPGIYENEKIKAINNLEASKNEIDPMNVLQLCKLIHSSKSVTIIGANHSLELFKNFQKALFSIGKICYIFRQEEKCRAHIETLQRGNLAIFVSVAGRYQQGEGNFILQELKKKRVRCVLITQARDLSENNFDLVIHYGQSTDRNAGYYSLETLADVLAKCIVK